MKTSSIYHLTLSLLLTATLATGCQKEQRTGITPGKETTATLPGIHIRQEQFIMPEFQTSAANKVARAEDDEICPFTVDLKAPTAEDSLVALTKAVVSFSNLWVFQFGADGNLVKSQKVASVAAGEDLSVTLTAGTDYSIGLVANAPSDFSSSAVTTLDQFRSGALFTHASITPDALPYAGEVSGVTVYDNGTVTVEGQDIPTIMVERVTAEVTVNLTYNVSGYELDGLEMYNVPLKGAYSNSSATYPIAETGNFSYTDNTEKGLAPQKTEGTKYTWYIQANRRGSVASITAQQQKNAQNAPQYATYVRVKTHMTDTYNELYYDIYLGENMLSNFNVTGNHTYQFQTRIAGYGVIHQQLPETDPRVTASTTIHIAQASVEPDPKTVTWEGGDYTVALKGFWYKDIPVRIYSGSSALVEGKVAYVPNTQGGSTVLKVPQNPAPQPERPLSFQYQWEGEWKEIASGTQQKRPLYIEKATVSPDPTNFSYSATAFTVTLTGAWDSSVPVRAIIDGNSVALVSGSVTTSGTGVKLTIPANAFPNKARTIVFQYQWEGKWVEIDRGTQAAEPASITKATVSPDPTSIQAISSVYTVTLTGKWIGTVPVRTIVNGQSTALSTASVTASGSGVKLTVPANNYPNPARTIIFQYQLGGTWKEFDRGTQAKGEGLDVGLNFILQAEPNKLCTWQEAINYCKTLGTGWRLPTSNELLFYWAILPALTSDNEKFVPNRYYWGSRVDRPNEVISLHSGSGHINSFKMEGGACTATSQQYARCAKSIERDNTYPKIEMNNGYAVVTFRDEFGGLNSNALLKTPQESSILGTDAESNNRVSRKFRIQKSAGTTTNWTSAKSYCDNLTEGGYTNWRLPTQRETMLLFAIGGNNYVSTGDQTSTGDVSTPIVDKYLYQYSGFTPFTKAMTWSSTKNTLTTGEHAGWYWVICMGDIKKGQAGYDLNTGNNAVRCIRDEKESWPTIPGE